MSDILCSHIFPFPKAYPNQSLTPLFIIMKSCNDQSPSTVEQTNKLCILTVKYSW